MADGSLSRPSLPGIDHELGVILFAGGGGSSLAYKMATGLDPDVAVNHDAKAIEMHRLNHPSTMHIQDSVWNVDNIWSIPRGPVGRVWASPSCQHHSQAGGGRPRSSQDRALCEVMIPLLRERRPAVAFLENVNIWEDWGPLGDDNKPIDAEGGALFRAFVAEIRALGYSCEWRSLNSADYGMPTKRHRLYMVARRDGSPAVWPEPTHGPGRLPYVAAKTCLDLSLPTTPIFDHVQRSGELGHTDATNERIATGFRKFCLERKPFIVNEAAWFGITKGYGERKGQEPRTWDIERPLPTVVAGGVKQRLAVFWIRKDNTTAWGQHVDDVMDTITCKDTKRLMRLPIGESSPRVAAWFKRWLPDLSPVLPIDGVDYPIADIHDRVLHPRELARAMGFPDSYALPPGASEAIRRLGNAVTPMPAAEIMRLNRLDDPKPPKRRAS